LLYFDFLSKQSIHIVLLIPKKEKKQKMVQVIDQLVIFWELKQDTKINKKKFEITIKAFQRHNTPSKNVLPFYCTCFFSKRNVIVYNIALVYNTMYCTISRH
jgi:hypothetical protein